MDTFNVVNSPDIVVDKEDSSGDEGNEQNNLRQIMLEPPPQESSEAIDNDHFDVRRGTKDVTLDEKGWQDAIEDSDEDIDLMRPPPRMTSAKLYSPKNQPDQRFLSQPGMINNFMDTLFEHNNRSTVTTQPRHSEQLIESKDLLSNSFMRKQTSPNILTANQINRQTSNFNNQEADLD